MEGMLAFHLPPVFTRGKYGEWGTWVNFAGFGGRKLRVLLLDCFYIPSDIQSRDSTSQWRRLGKLYR